MFLCLDHQVGLEEDVEGLGQLCFDLAVLVDVELLEERLVELASQLRCCGLVELVALLDESQAAGQGLFNLLEGQVGPGQLGLGTLELLGDASLFGFEEVEGHGVGVVGVEQLLALAAEFLQSATSHSFTVFGAAAQVFEILAEQSVQQVRVLGMEPEGAVLGFDLLLDLVDPHVASNAVGALLVASDAEEVLVGRAVPVGLLVEAEPATAGAAEDTSAQVVGEASVLLPGAVGIEDGLDFVATADRWFMRYGERYSGALGMCNNGGCDGGSCNGPGD